MFWIRHFKRETELMPQSKRSEQEEVLVVMKYVWNEEEGPCPFPSYETVTVATSSILIRLCLLLKLGHGFKKGVITFYN